MKTTHNLLLCLPFVLTFLLSLTTSALTESQPGFGILKGRWVRTYGGYVIEIKSIEAGDRMQVAYYNAEPIHASRAEAGRSGGPSPFL